jgi:hypothetical protein
MLRVWLAIGAVIAIVFGGLACATRFNASEAVSSHIGHGFIPPFRG